MGLIDDLIAKGVTNHDGTRRQFKQIKKSVDLGARAETVADGTWDPMARKVRKVTEPRRKRLKEEGVHVNVGDDDPGLPASDKALSMVRRSVLLTWIWLRMTGEDPHLPLSAGGTLGERVPFDRSMIEGDFVTHAMFMGETREDIISVLSSAQSINTKTGALESAKIKTGGISVQTSYFNTTYRELDRVGRVDGGGPGADKKKYHENYARYTIKSAPGVTATKDLIAAFSLALNTSDPAKTYQKKSNLLTKSKGLGPDDVLKVTAAFCMTNGLTYTVYTEMCAAAGVNQYRAELAWMQTAGRIEVNLIVAGLPKLKKVVGDKVAKGLHAKIQGCIASAGLVEFQKSSRKLLDQRREDLGQTQRHPHADDPEPVPANTPAFTPDPARTGPEAPHSLTLGYDDGGVARPIPPRAAKVNALPSVRHAFGGRCDTTAKDSMISQIIDDLADPKYKIRTWDNVSRWPIRTNKKIDSVRFTRTAEAILEMKESVKSYGAHHGLGVVVGQVMALATIPSRIVNRLAEDAELKVIQVAYGTVMNTAIDRGKSKRRGGSGVTFKAPMKIYVDLFNLMASGWTRGEIIKLQDAMVMDGYIHDMTTKARLHLAPAMPWATPERRTIQSLLRVVEERRTAGDPVAPATVKILKDTWMCSQFQHVMECDIHGVRKVHAPRCKRDVACPLCLGFSTQVIAQWILTSKSWPENLIVYRFEPSDGPVSVKVAEAREPEEEDAEAVALGAEESFDESEAQRRALPRRLSDNLHDRLMHGLRTHEEMKNLQKFSKQLSKGKTHEEMKNLQKFSKQLSKGKTRDARSEGRCEGTAACPSLGRFGDLAYRAFLGPKETYLVLPSKFSMVRRYEDHVNIDGSIIYGDGVISGSAIECVTQDLLNSHKIMSTLTPQHFSKEEFVSFLVKTRIDVGQLFGELLIDLTRSAQKAEEAHINATRKAEAAGVEAETSVSQNPDVTSWTGEDPELWKGEVEPTPKGVPAAASKPPDPEPVADEESDGQETSASRRVFYDHVRANADEILSLWTLKNRALYVMRNKAAEEKMPWFDKEQLKAMLKAMRGDNEAPLGRCDKPLSNEEIIDRGVEVPPGQIVLCLKRLSVRTEDSRTAHILAENSDGVIPRTDEIQALAKVHGCFHSKRVEPPTGYVKQRRTLTARR